MNKQKKALSSKAIENRFDVIRVLAAIAISLIATLLLIAMVSEQPLDALREFMAGPVVSMRNFSNVLNLFVPLCFAGLSVSVMFQCNQINMGSEGAFFIGGLGAAFIGVRMPLPAGVHPAVAILFGAAVGAVVCVIPGIFKVKWGADEVVSSLMINYILLYFGNYILQYHLLDPQAGYPATEPLPETVVLPNLSSKPKVHIGILIALVLVVVVYIFLYKSKWGYELRAVGQNEHFARYAGMGVGSTILLSQIVGGALAGAGGATQVLGMYQRYSWTALPGYGFDGIIIAILAKNSPAFVPFAAFFLAYLRIGADIMSRHTDVATEVVAVVQALIILLVAAKMFLGKMKHKQIVANSERRLQQKQEV